MVVEGCDYELAPVGGQLSFCKQLVQIFTPDEICLVGVSTSSKEPVGLWFKKEIDCRLYECFNLYRLNVGPKPKIPLRIMNFLSILRYRSKILNKADSDLIFIQSPELMIGYSLFNSFSCQVAYFFHGVENPLSNPRYSWGKIFSKVFWTSFIKALNKSNFFLAAADTASIQKSLGEYSHLGDKVVSFPTRYDDDTFCLKPVSIEFKERFNKFENIIVATGRLNKVKGWDFTLKAFHSYIGQFENKNTCLVFVGDGEDRQQLEYMISALKLDDRVFITGFVGKEEVAEYLNLADLYFVGSLVEGWSIAMLEALACGLPVISTDVSGAHELVNDGKNGYVCKGRDIEYFGNKINKTLQNIPKNNETSLIIASNYKVSGLKPALLMALSVENPLCLQ
jgi:glycosyltransferase involved in cell wall biosynthesis